MKLKNNIRDTFDRCKSRKKKALIAYLCAGYPKWPKQKEIIKALVEAGVDILEFGVPFSDPIADGPTIQLAAHKSLMGGTTLRKIIHWATALKRDINIPVVIMSYLNPIYKYGIKRFSRDAAMAGISGVIIPDLPLGESADVRSAFLANGICLIYFVAPTTPIFRQKNILKKGNGFIYAVSVRGVTGARQKYPPETKVWLHQLKRQSPHPVCVGFGISSPSHIRELKAHVDGFIVGSALIDTIRKSNRSNQIKNVKKFISRLSKECFYGC